MIGDLSPEQIVIERRLMAYKKETDSIEKKLGNPQVPLGKIEKFGYRTKLLKSKATRWGCRSALA